MAKVEADGLCVVVVGATGAVGQDLITALGLSALPIQELRAVASGTNTQASTEALGGDVRLQVLAQPVADSAVLDGADVAFFATPPDVTAELAPQVAELGIRVIDVGGALAGKAPLWHPLLGTVSAEEIGEMGRIVSSPSAPASALSTLMAPLVRLGANSCRTTILVSAGLAGRAGVDELSQQVTALFNTREPPRVVFPSGLAFDLLTMMGEATDSGVSTAEARIASEVGVLLGINPAAILTTAMVVPTFSGMALSTFVEIDPEPTIEDVRHELEQMSLIEVVDVLPGPRRLVGKSKLHVGRLRLDPLGRGVHLVAVADNLRFGASAPAITIASALWRAGRL